MIIIDYTKYLFININLMLALDLSIIDKE